MSNRDFMIIILFLMLSLSSIFYFTASDKVDGCYQVNDKLVSKIVNLEINASKARFYDNFSNVLYEEKVVDLFFKKYVEINGTKINFYLKSDRIYFENFFLSQDKYEVEEIWFEKFDCFTRTILLGPYPS